MDRTFLAGRFLVSELAPVQTSFGITQQLRAVLAKLLVTFMSPAVEPDHHPYRLLLTFYPIHHIINIIRPSLLTNISGYLQITAYTCFEVTG